MRQLPSWHIGSSNSKRADFVIVNSSGHVVLAVEYQGTGHYQGTARLRDAVKREAFCTAGVQLIESPARYQGGCRRTGSPSPRTPRTIGSRVPLRREQRLRRWVAAPGLRGAETRQNA